MGGGSGRWAGVSRDHTGRGRAKQGTFAFPAPGCPRAAAADGKKRMSPAPRRGYNSRAFRPDRGRTETVMPSPDDANTRPSEREIPRATDEQFRLLVQGVKDYAI